jgi:2-polyprenyl-3-methyl-5-hydroxy-6-metoxy-1,4-benzoquinol methylase
MAKKKYIPHAWESVNCPFCNSNRTKLHEKFGPELQFTYVECLDCELIYHSPRPKYDEVFLKDAYEEYYKFNPNYQYTEKSLSSWDKELQEILKFDKKRTSILDIGSCAGDFLNVAQKEYDHCVGVEVAENMAKFTEAQLKVKVHVGSYVDIDFKEKYSCIHMSHVIEHIPNPHEWIQKTKTILDDNGILVMSVPNMHSLNRRAKLFFKRIGLRKGNWTVNTRTPDHLFEPTISSTLRFFNSNGFKVLSYYTYSRKDMDANTLFGKIYNRKFMFGSNLRFIVTPKLMNKS